MKIDEYTENLIGKIAESQEVIFSDIVEVAGLDPQRDFIDANLIGVDFSNSDLSNYNFERADLRRANWKNLTAEPANFQFSMRGKASDPIHATDFEAISKRVISERTWKERFLAFAILVDNFGVNYLTFDLLEEVISKEKTTYMPLCSALYLSASAVSNHELTKYCREMASQENAYSNMFRVRKIRRLSKEFQNYFDAPVLGLEHTWGPGSVPFEKMARALAVALTK